MIPDPDHNPELAPRPEDRKNKRTFIGNQSLPVKLFPEFLLNFLQNFASKDTWTLAITLFQPISDSLTGFSGTTPCLSLSSKETVEFP